MKKPKPFCLKPFKLFLNWFQENSMKSELQEVQDKSHNSSSRTHVCAHDALVFFMIIFIVAPHVMMLLTNKAYKEPAHHSSTAFCNVKI